MTHVITRACCGDAACVPACPVNCIHPTPDEPGYGQADMLYIDPGTCVDCGACIDVCPVGAITADYDLAGGAEPYLGLNALYYQAPGRRDYPREQSAPPPRRWTAGARLRVAIAGSGPAACYAAEELLSQRGLDVEVDMFERLPVPGGLVRFGVAPDHRDTRAAASAFARTMRRTGLRLVTGTEVGANITPGQLQARFHAVIVATGATASRSLGIPGEDLAGSHPAAEFVAWYNGHPDHAGQDFDLSAERAVVIGNGNVALDVARILATDPAALAGTGISAAALARLRDSRIGEVVVLGRRGDSGRVVDPRTGARLPGLYVAGWIKRGASGVIGTSKKCARETVAALLDDFAGGLFPGPLAGRADAALGG